MPMDPFAGFAVGRQLAQGQHPITDLVQQVTDRANTVGLLREEARLKVENDPFKLFAAKILAGTTGQQQPGTPPTPGTAPAAGLESRLAQIQGQLPVGTSLKMGPFYVKRPELTGEKANVVTSARSALRSLDDVKSLILPEYGGNPNRLFVKGLFGTKGFDVGQALQRMEVEIVTARGGKQLTEAEKEYIRSVIPNWKFALDAWLRNGDVSNIRLALKEIEKRATDVVQGLDPHDLVGGGAPNALGPATSEAAPINIQDLGLRATQELQRRRQGGR